MRAEERLMIPRARGTSGYGSTTCVRRPSAGKRTATSATAANAVERTGANPVQNGPEGVCSKSRRY